MTLSCLEPRHDITTAVGVEAWNYDPLGRAVTDRRSIGSVTKDFTYQYYESGALWKLTYPSGRTIEYKATSAGLAESAKDIAIGINYATGASYSPGGALQSVLLGQSGSFGGITVTQGFNPRGQPTTILASSTNGTVLNFSYNFVDANGKNNGNVVSIANNRNHGRDQLFTYDELNRIKTAQSAAASGTDCWGLQFGYDIWANLLSSSLTKCSAPILSVSVNTANRITNTGFTYDAAGNLLTDGLNTYTWDAESRMKSLNTTSVVYTYDGDGKRLKKSTTGSSVE